MPHDGPLLQLIDVNAGYGSLLAVQNLCLELEPKTIVSLIGPNGAGKSTTLNAILGVNPFQGAVRFCGVELSKLSIEDRVSLGLILVPERRELFGAMSVHDNLLLGGYRKYSLKSGLNRSKLDRVFDLFPRLKDRRLQTASSLSGGERQMLALGRALMAEPVCLLLDEPSLGLAPKIVQELLISIEHLKAEGISILLVEQNARAALRISDYGYIMESGSVVMQGRADELLADKDLMKLYLGIQGTGASE